MVNLSVKKLSVDEERVLRVIFRANGEDGILEKD